MIKAALRSLLGRKMRLLMSTFAIVLGVAFVAGSLIFSDMLNRSFTAIFASSVGDVIVRPEGGASVDGTPSTLTVPSDLIPRLESVPGAARVDGNVSAVGVFVVSRENKLIGGNGAPGIAVSWSDAPAGHGLEGLSVVEGRAPEGDGEVALDVSAAEKAGYDVGDTIRVITSTDTPVLQPELVGLVDFADGGSLNGATLTVFDTDSAQRIFLGGQDAYTDVWVTAEGGTSQAELRDRVREELPGDLEAITGDDAADESGNMLLEAVSFITTFLLIFAGIALVVGAFLIANTFSILVAQRSRELALLRALGASQRQVTRSVLAEAAVVGALGSTLGLGLGILLALAIRAMFAQVGLDLSGQGIIFAPRTVIAGYTVGVLITMAAAWLPARRTARIAPVQALRDDVALPESSIHRRLVAGIVLLVVGAAALTAGLFLDVPRAGWLVGGGVLMIFLGVTAASPVLARPVLHLFGVLYSRVFGPVGNLAGQNARRNPRRTTATASALMIGLALATTMAILGSSAKASVDRIIEDNFVGDYVVGNVVGQGFSPAIGDQMAQVDGVQTVVRQRYAPVEVEGDDTYVAAVDRRDLAGLLDLTMAEGSRDDLVDGAVLVSEEYAADHGVTVGDELEMDTPAGTDRYPVVGEYEENPLIGAGVVTTLPTLAAAGYPESDNQLIIDTDGSPGVHERLDAVVADLPVVSVKDQAEFASEQREPIDQLVLMIYALLGLALVIAVLGIVNTLALSVIERTRELGLLRAIGISRRQLRRMIGLESVVIAVLGAVLGLLLGLCFGVVLMYALRDEGLEVISVPGVQLVVFLVLSIVIGFLAAVFPARRAARLDVLRAIAAE
ncbi:FtsX family ABC transporter permease [Nocardioides sp.]|uniref:ABC transporter permease n=1 Tax=Nocardioides sp. TaxID=35761 RepID=UPI0026396038|nr:FtsX family ABC transporter permease [Nocardioides sp.]MDI6911029.1 ABC transporter permease [Nocardioides sp.]